ncbi:hypothetical protein ACO0LV_17245 [Pseudactinotalea sp. Z1739]
MVLHTAGAALAQLVSAEEFTLVDPPLSSRRALPGGISPFHLRFRLSGP